MKMIHKMRFMSILGLKLTGFRFEQISIYLIFLILITSTISVIVIGEPGSPDNTESSQNSLSPHSTKTRASDPFDETEAMEWLEIDFEILFEQPDWLSISSEFNIHEIYLTEPYGQITADEIRKSFEVESKLLGGEPPVLIALNQRIEELLKKHLNKTFPNDLIIIFDPVRDVNSFYSAPDENKYEPAVIINQHCRVKLNNTAYFTAAELSRYHIQSLSDLIEGSLKMGGKVTMDLLLSASAGYKVSFLFRVQKFQPGSENYQNQLKITHDLNEIITKDDDRVKFTLDNLKSIYGYEKPIKGFTIRAKEPNKQTEQRINIDINLELLTFNDLWINYSRLNINALTLKHSLNKLPSNVSEIYTLSSDGLRLFYDNGFLDISDIELELQEEINQLEEQLTKAFNTSTRVVLDIRLERGSLEALEPLYWLKDHENFKRLGTERPVNVDLFSPIEIKSFKFGNASSETIVGLLNAGAIAKISLYIAPGFNYKYNLTLFDGVKFKDLQPIDGLGIGGYKYSITPNQAKELVIMSTHPAQYTSSKANMEVEIDLYELDIVGFNEYLASIRIKADGVLHRIKIEPNSRFARALPKHLTIDYYNSDTLRLVYTEGLLGLEEIEELMYAIIEENISKLLESDVNMKINFNEELLEFDGDIQNMYDDKPVNFNIRASGKMSITEDRFVRMGGFVTKQLELPVPGVKYWNVTYTLILPEHIKILGQPQVENTSLEHSRPYVGKGPGNRDELKITVYGDPEKYETEDDGLEVLVNLDIDLTIWFFLSKLMIPLVLFITLCIILIVLILYRRHKSNRLERLLSDPEVVVAEEEYGLGLGEVGMKRGRRVQRPKRRRIRQTEFETGYAEDYGARVRELIPRDVLDKSRSTKRPRDKLGHIGRRRKGGGRSRERIRRY